MTTYGYDALDDLISVNQSGRGRTFQYDSLKRLSQAVNPESGTVSYGYDAAGNLLTKTDARGVTTSYCAYDALNRVTCKSYSDGTATVAYTYDTSPNGKGRLASVSNGSGNSATSYLSYDALGRVLSSSQTTNGKTYPLSYAYNLAGALTSETYPSGRVVTTGYDGANRTAWVQGAQAGVVTNYSGDPSNSTNWIHYWPHGAVYYFTRGNTVWHADSTTAACRSAKRMNRSTTRTTPRTCCLSRARTGAWAVMGGSYDNAGNQTVVNGNTLSYDTEHHLTQVVEV